MRIAGKLLLAGGLVILTGPFCFTAGAVDYVDVEAERAAAQTSSADTPVDPYAAPPSQTYPATSFGLNNAPAGTPVTNTAATPAGTRVSGPNQNTGALFLQLQQLREEVMRLNGIVEEQGHELRTLKEQSLQRYMDLDKRLGSAGKASPAGTEATSVGAIAPAAGVKNSQQKEQLGEGDAYRAAYALVRDQRFDDAVAAFNSFLQNYPDGRYAPNAHYWLGELYLVVTPQQLESARQAFTLLLSQYPDNAKVADAMYKLGKVYFLKGNRQKAREYLDRVVEQYNTSNASAAKLARDFIAENY